FQIAQLDAVERLALARLDEFVFDNHIGIAVHHHLQAAPKFAGAVNRHFNSRWLEAKCAQSAPARYIKGAYDTRKPSSRSASPLAAIAGRRHCRPGRTADDPEPGPRLAAGGAGRRPPVPLARAARVRGPH